MNDGEIDPILTNDMSGVSTSEPLLPKKSMTMEVVKVEQKANSKGTGNIISIQLRTTEAHESVTGEPIPAGRFVFDTIGITPTEKNTKEMIQRRLKKFQVACGVNSGPFHPLEQYEGRKVLVTVGISKTTDEYPDARNQVKAYDVAPF